MYSMLSDLVFVPQIKFSDACSFDVSAFVNILKTRIVGTVNSTKIQQIEVQSEKVMLWFTVHTNGVIDSYYFNKEIVKNVDLNRGLDAFVW